MIARALIFTAATLTIAAPAWAQFGGPAKVAVATVELRELPASSTLVGTVEPVTRSVVGSEITSCQRGVSSGGGGRTPAGISE